jgi:hypothetical protein
MKLHDAYGVHKENESCKSEIMSIKKGKKLKNKVNFKNEDASTNAQEIKKL